MTICPWLLVLLIAGDVPARPTVLWPNRIDCERAVTQLRLEAAEAGAWPRLRAWSLRCVPTCPPSASMTSRE